MDMNLKTDSVHEQLAERIDDLEYDKLELLKENDRLRKGMKKARIYAGEQLPARQGLTIVHMLEQTMKGER